MQTKINGIASKYTTLPVFILNSEHKYSENTEKSSELFIKACKILKNGKIK